LEKTKDLLDQIKLKYKLEVAFVDSPTTAEMLREPSYEVGVDP
jgi:hypothetical protein